MLFGQRTLAGFSNGVCAVRSLLVLKMAVCTYLLLKRAWGEGRVTKKSLRYFLKSGNTIFKYGVLFVQGGKSMQD